MHRLSRVSGQQIGGNVPRRGAARLACVLLLVAAALPPACRTGPTRPHEVLTSGAEPLRSAFNRDAGKVRLLMIGGPT